MNATGKRHGVKCSRKVVSVAQTTHKSGNDVRTSFLVLFLVKRAWGDTVRA